MNIIRRGTGNFQSCMFYYMLYVLIRKMRHVKKNQVSFCITVNSQRMLRQRAGLRLISEQRKYDIFMHAYKIL